MPPNPASAVLARPVQIFRPTGKFRGFSGLAALAPFMGPRAAYSHSASVGKRYLAPSAAPASCKTRRLCTTIRRQRDSALDSGVCSPKARFGCLPQPSALPFPTHRRPIRFRRIPRAAINSPYSAFVTGYLPIPNALQFDFVRR